MAGFRVARCPCQNFDVYVQKADNVQPCNEPLNPTRRYVLIRVSAGKLSRVRVVTGADLAVLDTGTLTQKFQARLAVSMDASELISPIDTERLQSAIALKPPTTLTDAPTSQPKAGQIIPIAEIWKRLFSLIGQTFENAGADQERNRGASLHRMVCIALGYENYSDDGRFPDILGP